VIWWAEATTTSGSSRNSWSRVGVGPRVGVRVDCQELVDRGVKLELRPATCELVFADL
jgi:hypothetical protein